MRYAKAWNSTVLSYRKGFPCLHGDVDINYAIGLEEDVDHVEEEDDVGTGTEEGEAEQESAEAGVPNDIGALVKYHINEIYKGTAMGETLKDRLHNVVDDGVNGILLPSVTTQEDSSVYDGKFYFIVDACLFEFY